MALVAVLVSHALAAASASPAVAVPGLGTLNGGLSQEFPEVALFNRIPYALPPTGDRRWRPPEPHGAWESPRDATGFGDACLGLIRRPEGMESEDCLFLNVAAPAAALGGAAAGLPVMVYIHGGAYNNGASNFNRPDVLVARSDATVLVVTLNYRLHLFGFLGSVGLRGRSGDGSFGNYGIQDQRLAIAWVREHIAPFGGNGSDVTIFGESAGGNSVLNHLTQPASFHLYQKAILESGDYRGTLRLAEAERAFGEVLALTACGGLACLLQRGAYNLSAAAASVGTWGPVVDGVSLAALPLELLERGEFNGRVPVMLGSNRDEAALWFVGGPPFDLPANLTEPGLNKFFSDYLLAILGKAGLEQLHRVYAPGAYEYPADLGNYSQEWWTAMRVATDGGPHMPQLTSLGHCSVRRAARALARHGCPGLFVYLFSQPTPVPVYDLNEGLAIPGTGPGSPVVPHASELPYVYGWAEALGRGSGEAELARAVSARWLRFARTGSPSGARAPAWPRYDPDGDSLLEFAAGPGGIRPRRRLRDAACNFWDAQLSGSPVVVV